MTLYLFPERKGKSMEDWSNKVLQVTVNLVKHVREHKSQTVKIWMTQMTVMCFQQAVLQLHLLVLRV